MPQSVTALADFTKYDSIASEDLVSEILVARGVTDVDFFLNTPKPDEAFLLKLQEVVGDVGRAITLIRDAMEQNAAIFIHGDYDVDGISATAILWETLYYELDYKSAFPFIPHRMEHGYGLSTKSVDGMLSQLKEKDMQPGLLITVDCGIVSKDTVAYAQEQGFTVIVTDHHTKPSSEADLPNADAILHTHELCGAGISWVLARSISGSINTGIDLAALATLSDLQDVTGYNRVVLKKGLESLSHTTRAGLQALYQLAGIKGPIGVYEVGWVIGPRLNASGRLDHALNGLRLLVARGYQQALPIARQLDELNRERQQMTQQAILEACAMVESQWNKSSPIVVVHSDWHEGVIGIVASGLVEKYKVPAIVISHDDTKAKGSARSIDGINIVDLLRQNKAFFDGVGGHAMAAGFSLATSKLIDFSTAVSEISVQNSIVETAKKPLVADALVRLDQLSWDLFEGLQKLEPFGLGHPRPVFYTQNADLLDFRVVGKQADHLQVTLSNNIRGIGFGLGEKAETLITDSKVGVLYSLDKDDFRGGNSIQLKIKEIFGPN